jgi:hypothetical protein
MLITIFMIDVATSIRKKRCWNFDEDDIAYISDQLETGSDFH